MANYRRVFLNGYSYFITVVTYERNPILIDNIDLLRQSFKYAKSKFAFTIEEIVILPDHLHMIISVESAEDYPKIISSIKRHFSKNCHPKFYQHITQSHHRESRGYLPVWQKRFYEHTIRDEKDYRARVQYMFENPVKHHLVQNPSKWRHSSFNYLT